MSELKPKCPLCQSEMTPLWADTTIRCPNIKCELYSCAMEAQAVEALNRRAPSAEQHQSDDLPANEEIATHWCKELVAALKRLSFAAQTIGGTAGRDEELCAAINQAEEALSIGATNRALLAAEQQQQEPAYPCEGVWHWDRALTRPEIDSIMAGADPRTFGARRVVLSRVSEQQQEPVATISRPHNKGPLTVLWHFSALSDGTKLYTHQQPPVQSLSQRMAEAGFTPRKSPKTAGGLIREDEQPQAQGEPTDYAIALQRAIEQYCHHGAITQEIAQQCPHHASMLMEQPRAAVLDVGEEIHVNIEGGDVYTLPLKQTNGAPRFVVHVPGQNATVPARFKQLLEQVGLFLNHAADHEHCGKNFYSKHVAALKSAYTDALAATPTQPGEDAQ